MSTIEINEFDWDKANTTHIARHKVTREEAEEVFFDPKQVTYPDAKHSTIEEKRTIIIGETDEGRLLYQVFTVRKGKIRVVSTRDINKKEVKLYEKTASRS
ncbi:MAG TPA: BrnT family toxin [Candidatus Saccharimonadales bacterium]|nr:BrnT family toxin [Candidatus Saccharimonadales bacterium]